MLAARTLVVVGVATLVAACSGSEAPEGAAPVPPDAAVVAEVGADVPADASDGLAEVADDVAEAIDSGAQEPNQPPVAVDDSATAPSGAPLKITALYNDYDPDGDIVTIASATQPKYGSVEVIYGGLEVEYTPPGDLLSDMDTFAYTIADSRGGTATATVTVELVALPTLTITSPQDGAVITSGKLVVNFEATGCTFTAPENDAQGCHGHKFLDGQKWTAANGKGFGHYTTGIFAITPLTKGQHTFTFVLAKNDGTDDPWVPEVSDSVSFVVP